MEITREPAWNRGDVISGGGVTGVMPRGVLGNLLLVNSSVIKDGGGNYAALYGGAAPGDTIASGNAVILRNHSESQDVYGGYSVQGSAVSNKAYVDASTVHGNVVGGKSDSAAAGHGVTGNEVQLSTAEAILSPKTPTPSAGPATVEGDAVGGLATGSGVYASGNRVTMENGAWVKGSVYGGSTLDADADGNVVTIDGARVGDGPFTGNVYGGYVAIGYGNAQNNVATVSGTVRGSVYGGRSLYGTAIGNTATVGGGTVGSNVYGGYSAFGDTRSNTATISGGTVASDVFGGFNSDSGSSYDNAAYITGGGVGGSVFGARASYGAYNNHAEISSAASVIAGDLVGCESNVEATGNTAVVNAGTVRGDRFGVAGGVSWVDAWGNSAVVNSGTVEANVYGGVAGAGAATGNDATVFNGDVTGDIVGGESQNGAATGNSASLWNGNAANLYGGSGVAGASGNSATLYSGAIRNDVVGGLNGAGSPAINNTVTLYGGSIGGRLLGGDNSLDYTGNTLNLRGFFGAVREVNNFQNYNLFVPAALGAGSTLLTVSGGVPTDLSRSFLTSFTLDPSGTNHYRDGDAITLISSTTGAGGIDILYANMARGVSSLYDMRVLEENNALVARVVGGRKDNPQSETLTGAVLTGLNLVNLGGDLIAANALDQAWKSGKNCEESGRWSFFSSLTYEDVDIDGRVDTNGGSSLVGMAWRDRENCDRGFLGGAFFETGFAGYDGSHTYPGVGRARFDGDVLYYGSGGLARYKLENRLRVEASARFGRVESDYSASEYAGGYRPSFDLDTWYAGMHAGTGWDADVGERFNLDLSAKYFWVRQFGKTVRVGDERVRFDAADSHRLKAGARLTFMPRKRVDVYAGAYYVHEFGGDPGARNCVTGTALNTLDMGGASGVFELGVSILPTRSRNVVVDLMVTGSTGTRKGVGGHLSVGWNF